MALDDKAGPLVEAVNKQPPEDEALLLRVKMLTEGESASFPSLSAQVGLRERKLRHLCTPGSRCVTFRKYKMTSRGTDLPSVQQEARKCNVQQALNYKSHKSNSLLTASGFSFAFIAASDAIFFISYHICHFRQLGTD